MSALKQVAQGFRNMWGHADDDDDYGQEEFEETETAPEPARHSSRDSAPSRSEKYEKYTSPPSPASQSPAHGGGSGNHLRKLRPVANPLRSAREKNIYTLKPKSMDEVSLAADYLKTGCAVVVNLEDVDRSVAVRIIDFMSGVCYGLEHQGHAMKLGETIFLFTPGDFEISSDEADYGENRDVIFKDMAASAIVAANHTAATSPSAAAQPASGYGAPSAGYGAPTPSYTAPPAGYNSPAPRAWER